MGVWVTWSTNGEADPQTHQIVLDVCAVVSNVDSLD